MSNAIFSADSVTFVGLTWDIQRSPQFNTVVQKATSGREVRAQLQPFPTDDWQLVFDNLPEATDFATLIGFYKQRGGSYDSFLLTVPSDKSVAGQSIGLGDGVTTSFLMSRTMGGFAEPVENCAASAVYLDGASIPTAGLAAPSAPTLTQVATGALAAHTYFAKITYVSESGETVASSEASLAVSINNVLHIASPAALTGATGWNAYVSLTTNTETKQNGGTPIAIGTAWQEPTSGLVSGAALPGSNTTGWSITTPTVGYLNTLTFTGAPKSGAVITADFTYSWRVRFKDDTVSFNNFCNRLWELQSIDLVQVLN